MKAVYLISFLLPTLTSFNPKPIVFATVTANIMQQPAASLKTVDSKGAKAALTKQPNLVLLDVRTPQEYAGGHLKNAHNLNYNAPDFADKLAKFDKTKPYLVYCAVGGRSSKAAQLMQQMGFKQVINVSEGYASLKNAGMVVVE
ncbi:rhodanese-like domain-containing protein [Adhaeribacter rhizoryzae]|uniref:Rhodanese-like domain-containing protein n=1 Tax=Adhaeribacter rhizoryzae TaxID=2607907 RepID=A0A5M6D166_9BACT|nr:rhodanese-like domain-containing protein [Adhaeribacter rhizoryzae]KAA5541214.1 rhodanese-like domain-containing protein [Adhaeribacter rhizoryzae]